MTYITALGLAVAVLVIGQIVFRVMDHAGLLAGTDVAWRAAALGTTATICGVSALLDGRR